MENLTGSKRTVSSNLAAPGSQPVTYLEDRKQRLSRQNQPALQFANNGYIKVALLRLIGQTLSGLNTASQLGSSSSQPMINVAIHVPDNANSQLAQGNAASDKLNHD